MKISEHIKTKNGYVWIDTTILDNPLGNMLDFMGLGNDDAVPGEFETMVFESDGNKVISCVDLDKDNYATYEEAKKGHKAMVKKWKRK